MNGPTDFARHVPGFDFMQGLLKGAGAGLPHVGSWIAPTLDPDEIDKRIQELKTVQFWLEQNARLLATTIQALEVQRMTLSTLRTMNLPLADLAETLKARAPSTNPAARAPSAAPAAPAPAPQPARPTAAPQAAAPAASPAAPPLVDPVQWWGALTQQFTDLAAQALKDSVQAQSAQAAKAAAAAQSAAGAEATGSSGPASSSAPSPAPKRRSAGPRG